MWFTNIENSLGQIKSDLQAANNQTARFVTRVTNHENTRRTVYTLSTSSRQVARVLARRLQDCEIGITQPYFASLLLQRLSFQQATSALLPGAVAPTAAPEILNVTTPAAQLGPCDAVANEEFAFRMQVKVKNQFPGAIRFSFGLACSKTAVTPYVATRASLHILPQGQGPMAEAVQSALDSALPAQLAQGQFPLTKLTFDRFRLETLGAASGGHVSIFGRMLDTTLGPEKPNARAADIGQIADPPWPDQCQLAFRMKTSVALPVIRAKAFAEGQKQFADHPDLRLVSVDPILGPVPNSLQFNIVVAYHVHFIYRRYVFFGPEESVDFDFPIGFALFGFPVVKQNGNKRSLDINMTQTPNPAAQAVATVPLIAEGDYQNIIPAIGTDFVTAYLKVSS